jgi:hypothetical protein
LHSVISVRRSPGGDNLFENFTGVKGIEPSSQIISGGWAVSKLCLN